MTYRHLQVERRGHVTLVRLNRPAAANALNTDLMTDLEQVSHGFLDDEQTRVVVFTGNGKHFSAGADLKQSVQVPPPSLVMRRRQHGLGARMIKAIVEIPQVTIAAVNGAALGGGACIPTACDFRIGADDCFCGYPEVNLGINLAWHALPLCVRLIGPARAKRMIMLGAREDAPTLLSWGFIDAVVPAAELLQQAIVLAELYARQPPVAVQMIKQSINAVSAAMDDSLMHMDADQNILSALTGDRAEAMAAYFEQRPGVFKGD
jgi:enoyl-CoA hydratase/carnithine racemase